MKSQLRIAALLTALALLVALVGPAFAAGDPLNFSDVPSNHWASEEINALASAGIVGGVGDSKFDPKGNMTRAQYAAILLRATGNAEVKPANPTFSDVSATHWAYGFVEGANAADLMTGVGGGRFGPSTYITREQAAATLVRALDAQVNDNAVTGFADDASISAWARPGVAKAVELGLFTGKDGNKFAPKDALSRAEAAVIIYRLGDVSVEPADTTAPAITLGQQDGTVNKAELTVSGSVSEDATVTVNGSAVTVTAKAFSTTVTLVEGANTITVEATDAAGNKGTKSLVVTCDTTTPVITLDQESGNVYTSETTVSGSVSEDATVTVNGEAVTVTNKAFSTSVTLDEGANTITVEAADTAGNNGQASIQLTLVILPEQVASYTAVADPLGNTVVTVTVKADAVASVSSVSIKDQAATKNPGNATQWRITLDGQVEVSDADIAVTIVQPGEASAEVEGYTAVTDPLGNTVVTVTVKAASVAGVAGVTVKGQAATQNPNNQAQWRVTLDGNVAVSVGDIALTVTEPGVVDAIKSVNTLQGMFGETSIRVVLNEGITATGVTANGQALDRLADGSYFGDLLGLAAGSKVTVVVTTADGTDTREETI